jgi:hypothetical protein
MNIKMNNIIIIILLLNIELCYSYKRSRHIYKINTILKCNNNNNMNDIDNENYSPSSSSSSSSSAATEYMSSILQNNEEIYSYKQNNKKITSSLSMTSKQHKRKNRKISLNMKSYQSVINGTLAGIIINYYYYYYYYINIIIVIVIIFIILL